MSALLRYASLLTAEFFSEHCGEKRMSFPAIRQMLLKEGYNISRPSLYNYARRVGFTKSKRMRIRNDSPIIPAAEILSLIEALKKGKLLPCHEATAKSLLTRAIRGLPMQYGVDADDLMQDAWLGMLHGARKYDPDRARARECPPVNFMVLCARRWVMNTLQSMGNKTHMILPLAKQLDEGLEAPTKAPVDELIAMEDALLEEVPMHRLARLLDFGMTVRGLSHCKHIPQVNDLLQEGRRLGLGSAGLRLVGRLRERAVHARADRRRSK